MSKAQRVERDGRDNCRLAVRFVGILATALLASAVGAETPLDFLNRAAEATCPGGGLDTLQSLRLAGKVEYSGGDSAYNTMVLSFGGDRTKLWQNHEVPSGQSFLRILGEEDGFVSGIGRIQADLQGDLENYIHLRFPVILRQRSALQLTAAGTTEVDGHAVTLIRVTRSKGEILLGVDSESSLVRMIEYPFDDKTENQRGMLRRVYQDFRAVNGCTLPFRQHSTVDGELYSVWYLDTVVLNEELDPGLFSIPTK